MPAKFKWTMAAIRQENAERGFHFFDRKTLKFFGETMKNYSVRNEPTRVVVTRRGGNAGYAEFEFNPITGDLKKLA